jgi:hypothetical protein
VDRPALAQVMGEPVAVGDVLRVLDRDQRVVEAAIGDRPVDDPGGEPGEDRTAEDRVGPDRGADAAHDEPASGRRW